MLLVVIGKKIQAKKQDRGYEAVPVIDAIGRKDKLCLWILGRA